MTKPCLQSTPNSEALISLAETDEAVLARAESILLRAITLGKKCRNL